MIKVGLSTAKLMFIIAAASLFGWIMARENAPLLMTKAFLSISDNPYVVLLMINILLLVLGCVMETIAVMVILVPILTPLVQSMGVDLIHFGVMITLNLMIGLVTPPVGMVMYAVISIAKVSVIEFTRESLPFIIALLAVLFLITYFPSIVLWVPSLFLE
jgi:tripartite ATP-independent transporter DctM subunit